MSNKIDDAIKQLNTYDRSIVVTRDSFEEAIEFLEWVKNHNYIFMGYAKYDYLDSKGQETLVVGQDTRLGIFLADQKLFSSEGLNNLPVESLRCLTDNKLLDITKSSQLSLVHRNVPMDYIGIKIFNDKGMIIGEHRFIGLFTSKFILPEC